MKRTITILMLCALLFLIPAGTIRAGNMDYSIMEYMSLTICTVDGEWTADDEWTDTPISDMSGTATGQFGYNVQDFTALGLEWIVEFFDDDTDDSGDYWQICFDDLNTGGSAPDDGDFMIEIVGHSTLTAYQGTGSGWIEVTPEDGELTWADSVTTSPWSDTDHWILEITDLSKTSGTLQIPNAPDPGTGMFIAAYDESTDTIATWAPDGDPDVPDTWGVVAGYSMEPIPEGLTFAIMVFLSSVSLLVGSQYLKNRSKKREE